MHKANFKQLEEIASTKTPCLYEGFIPEKGIGALIGEWGIGKSPFAIQLQLSLAAGIPFLNRYKPATQGRVIKTLYVDLENGAHSVRNIVQTISTYLELPEPPASWEVYSPYYTPKPDAKKSWSEEQYLRDLLSEDHYDFVIIDPLRMFKPDAESKNPVAAQMLLNIRRLIDKTNTTVLFIHHPRKPPADADVQRYHLDSNPSEWMANACGAASLIQNCDFRIGLEQNEEGYLMLRHFMRNEGWSPVQYLDRAFDPKTDNPVGYVLKLGMDQLQHNEKNWWADLPFDFTTKEFKMVTRKNDRICNDLLKRWVSLLVIQKTGHGRWQKIPQEELI
jgi:hypothetical protein